MKKKRQSKPLTQLQKEARKVYMKIYRENPEKKIKAKLSRKKYKDNNPEKVKVSYAKSAPIYYEKNLEKILSRQLSYKKDNLEKVLVINRKSNAKYKKKKRAEDPLFKLINNIRNLISCSFKKNQFKKHKKSEQILGCSFDDFKKHINSLLEPWMNEKNYGPYNSAGPRTWNIDHIIPVDSAKTKEDVIRLNHYTNLRPLCSKENNLKRNKLII